MSLLAYLGSIALALTAGVIISPWVRDLWWRLDDWRHDRWRQFLHPAHVRQHADPFAWMAAETGQPGGSREPVTVPSLLLTSEETTQHADAMWQASEEYLPAAPEPQPYAPVPLALPWVPQERRQTEDHPPWTGSQPALTSEMEARMGAAELDRRLHLAAHLAGAAQMTDDDVKRAMRDAMDALRQPVPASSFPCCEHCDTGPCTTPHHVACIDCQPVYGEASVAGVLAAQAQDGAPVMLP